MTMTLGFSTHWPEKMGDLAGEPNFFVEKIWAGLEKNEVEFFDLEGFSDHSISDLKEVYSDDYDERFRDSTKDNGWSIYHKPIIYPPKLHTIRHDPHDRWKPGVMIHMVINNRTRKRFQFVPLLECVDVQDIKIEYKGPIIKKANRERIRVYVDGNFLGAAAWSFEREKYKHNSFDQNIQKLTRNDGFDSVDHFFRWFDTDTKLNTKIIHWTNLKY